MKYIISESQYSRLINEGYEQIRVREIPNDLVPFSDKDISTIEGFISNLNSRNEIKLEREDLRIDRYPRIMIYIETDYGTNLMYLYKTTKGRFFVHTRQHSRYEDLSLNTYSLKSLSYLPSVFMAYENRGLFNLK